MTVPRHTPANRCWDIREAQLTRQGSARHLGDRIAAGRSLVAHALESVALPLRASLQRVVTTRGQDFLGVRRVSSPWSLRALDSLMLRHQFRKASRAVAELVEWYAGLLNQG